MIAMRADAMSGGYWNCHDTSSVLNYGTAGNTNLLAAPFASYPTKRATNQSSEVN